MFGDFDTTTRMSGTTGWICTGQRLLYSLWCILYYQQYFIDTI